VTRARAAAVAASGVLVASVYLLRLDRVVGLFIDDAWYVLLAKALSQGDGFLLISSASTPIPPNVPPFFPAILAVCFRVAPDFPANVPLLKSVSVASMFAVGPIAYRYLTRYRGLPWPTALGIVVATLLTPGLVFLATSTVMAECVFTAGQMATLLVVERSVRKAGEGAGLRAMVLAAALAAGTLLVRSTGIALVAAVGLYLLMLGRWRRAVVFGLVTMLCVAPWSVYARVHAPTAAQRTEHGGSIAYAYGDAMRMRVAGRPTIGVATPADIWNRFVTNVVNVFGRDVGAIIVPAFFRGADESGQEVTSLGRALGLPPGSMGNSLVTLAISFVLSAICFVGYIAACRERITAAELLVPLSIGMTLLVPFWTYRYVLPLAPFVFLYLLAGIRAATTPIVPFRSITLRDPWKAARIAILSIICLDAADHAQYIVAARNDPGRVDWIADAREIDEVLAWMDRNLHDEGRVASTNPALIYLRTGRKGFAMDDAGQHWDHWKASGIRYVVCLRPSVPLPTVSRPFNVLFQTSRHRLWIVEI
jgi:hypothetical protein